MPSVLLRPAILATLIAAVPLSALAYFVSHYAVAIPAFDDWEMAPIIIKARTGALSFQDLFAQQQESRTVFPKLIFVLLASGAHWDVRAEMALSIVLSACTALGIYLLLRKSHLSPRATLVCFGLMACLIFSLAQQELWLLGSGFPSFVPPLCIVFGLVAIESNLNAWTKFAICAGLSFFASFSLASGLFGWLLTFPVFLIAARPPQLRTLSLAWIAATMANAAIYFWEFHAQADLPTFASGSISLGVYLKYFFAFLGSPFGRVGTGHPFAISILAGIIQLLIYGGVSGFILLNATDRSLFRRAAPWFALGAYAVGNAVLAALGRAEYGERQALESRYIVFSLYLAVADIALVALVRQELVNRAASSRRFISFAVGSLAAVCFVLENVCGLASIAQLKSRAAWGRLGRAAVFFSQSISTSRTIKITNYPRPNFVRAEADLIDRLHLFRPPLARSNVIADLRHGQADGRLASGSFDGMADVSATHRVAWGWAMLNSKRRSADSVVLGYATKPDNWILFAISSDITRRDDVAKTLRDADGAMTGWDASFPKNAVPAGAAIGAWAVDAADGKLYRLKDSAAVLNPTL